MHIQFMYFEDCPSHDEALERLQGVLADENITAEVEIIRMETDEQAKNWHFVGSPTILVNGQDIDPPPSDAYYSLTCRVYRREDGRFSPLPPVDMIRRAVSSTPH